MSRVVMRSFISEISSLDVDAVIKKNAEIIQSQKKQQRRPTSTQRAKIVEKRDLVKELFQVDKVKRNDRVNTFKRARFSPLTIIDNELEMTNGRLLNALSSSRNLLKHHSSLKSEQRKRANSDYLLLDQVCLPRKFLSKGLSGPRDTTPDLKRSSDSGTLPLKKYSGGSGD